MDEKRWYTSQRMMLCMPISWKFGEVVGRVCSACMEVCHGAM